MGAIPVVEHLERVMTNGESGARLDCALINRIAVCWLTLAASGLLACGRTDLGRLDPSRGTHAPADAAETGSPPGPIRTTWDQFPRFCSVDEWCGSSVVFRGVWGSASDDVWVVATGVSRNGPSAPYSTILHWDGSDWLAADWFRASEADAATGPQASLYAIWGSGADDVWTVGSSGITVHWNGTGWSAPDSITSADLRAVWGSTTQDVWAVGSGGTILHYDGKEWLATPSATTADLLAVWGSSADSVWAVGASGAILHWTGSAWSAVASGTNAPLGGVWGSGPHDVWAVGSAGTVLHWDGHAWSAAAWSDTSKWNLAAVWGSGADDVWAVGAPSWVYPPSSYPYSTGGIAHWDGVAWSTVSILSMPSLLAVWGSASNNVWAVGGGVSLRWNGTTWLRSDPARVDLYAAWGNAANDLWAVGAHGIVVHWDGDAWSTALEPQGRARTGCAGNGRTGSGAIWGSGANDVWATTETAALLHWNGHAWSTLPTGANDALISVWGSGASDVWSVGCSGSIEHWNGSTWSTLPSPTKSALVAVSGTAPNDVWAAGFASTVVHWDGLHWSVQELPAVEWTPYAVGLDGTDWYLVSSIAPNDVWLMGAWTSAGRGGGYQGPASSHWDGTGWSNSKEPVAGAGIWLDGPDDRWLVGTSLGGFYLNHPQEIAHWNGVDWSDSLSGGSVWLTGIWGSSPREIWAVGGQGAILRKR